MNESHTGASGSTGEGMKNKSGGFYWERELYQSPAFQELTKNAMKVLIALMDARKRETPSQAKGKKGSKRKPRFINLDRIEMPYKTLQKVYGMNQHGITRAIDKLLANGFIEITHKGGLGEHDKARYALIYDYIHWKPGMVIRKRDRDVRRGYQDPELMRRKNSHTKRHPLHTVQNVTLPENSRTQNVTLQKPAFTLIRVGE